ncbi:MAG TPA: hypothetical protein VNO79_11355, partial [Actinomycetota bacterium]|nr:hypothetical protein [Actinomycetota bacterium]
MRRAAAALGLAAALAGGVAVASRPAVVEVRAGGSVEAAISAAPPGAVIRLGPGAYPPFAVDRRVRVVAAPGAVVAGPIR